MFNGLIELNMFVIVVAYAIGGTINTKFLPNGVKLLYTDE